MECQRIDNDRRVLGAPPTVVVRIAKNFGVFWSSHPDSNRVSAMFEKGATGSLPTDGTHVLSYVDVFTRSLEIDARGGGHAHESHIRFRVWDTVVIVTVLPVATAAVGPVLQFPGRSEK